MRRNAVERRGESQRGIAHANCFPAAGRLMRAGRAGAGGGSDARAHRLPSRSAGAQVRSCERDGDTSLSQCRLVNTNRPRSRDKIFDLHFTCTHTCARASSGGTHAHAPRELFARRSAPSHRRTAPLCYFWQFFQKFDMQRCRGRGASLPRG